METTEFWRAVDSGETAAALSLANADVSLLSATDETGISAVLRAMYRGHAELARALASRRDGDVSLFEAAALDESLRAYLLIATHRGRVDDVAPDGFTPLHLAAFFGSFHTVKILLERKASVDARSQNAMRLTPLHAAVAVPPIGKTERIATAIAASLLRAGADPDAQQNDGFTPMDAARQNGWSECQRLLLRAGATDPSMTGANLSEN